jgi:XTP/dITP diphosphohydrolase
MTNNDKKVLYFASANPGKVGEAAQLFGEFYQIKSLLDLPEVIDIPETGSTLEENSLLKANYFYDRISLPCFSDDTGLEVEALDGKPGVFSARYAGPEKDPNKNMRKILNELAEASNRKARFRTVVSLHLGSEIQQFEGIVDGVITKEKIGKGGFGYDPIFIPEGFDETFSQMDAATKNTISHRGKAFQAMYEFLKRRT